MPGGGRDLGWLETFRGSRIAASKCRGSRRQEGSRESPWTEVGESGERSRLKGGDKGREGAGAGVSRGYPISVSKGTGEETLKFWRVLNAHRDVGQEDQRAYSLPARE